MTHDESPLVVTAKGTVAGLASTAAVTAVMRFGPRALTDLGLLPEEAQPHEQPMTPPPTAQPPAMGALQLGWRLVYGWVTAPTFRLLSTGARAS